jgi:hypothetical protein
MQEKTTICLLSLQLLYIYIYSYHMQFYFDICNVYSVSASAKSSFFVQIWCAKSGLNDFKYKVNFCEDDFQYITTKFKIKSFCSCYCTLT